MANELLIPLNDLTRADTAEAQTFGDVMPRRLPEGENYAEDPEVMAAIADDLAPLIDHTRKERQPLHQEWMAIRRMEHQEHDDGKRYNGRSAAYLPVFNRMLATQVSTLSKGLFPSDEYMDCVSKSGQFPDRAKAVKAYIKDYEFERTAKIRKHMKVFLRQLKAFGNSPLKVLYRKEQRYEGRRFNLETATLGMQRQDSFLKVNYEGLQVSTRSLFNWYVYPMTSDSLEEATLVFEDLEVPRQYIEGMIKNKRWKNADAALSPQYISEVIQNRQDLQGEAVSSDFMRGPLSQVLTLTEAWTFLKLPKKAYLPDEDPECPVPVMVVLAGRIPLCVIRNPYYHQRPPYLFGSLNRHPGMIYGYGVGRLSRHLQYLANDFANQTNDAGTYSLNPIVKRNPALVAGPMRPIAPGVVWDFTDIAAGVAFERPPFEIIQHGMSMVNMLLNLNQELGGAPPQLSGSASGGSKTATGMQILQKNAMSPLSDEVEDLEQDIMVPLMYLTWYNAQQFRDRAVMASIAGEDISVSPEMLVLDAEFKHTASSQAINSAQRAQQLMQLVQALGPLVPILQQQGMQVNFKPLLDRVMADGMGLRGIGEIITAAPMMPPGMPGAMPGQAGMPPGQEGDRVRSAVEQAGGEQGEMAPGEGEAFADTRAEADEIAALLGATYGQG